MSDTEASTSALTSSTYASSSSSSSSSSSIASGEGKSHEDVRDLCSSGSISPPTEAKNLRYIEHSAASLKEFHIRLIEELQQQSVLLKYGEEGYEERIKNVQDTVRILSSELKHVVEPFIFERHYQKNINSAPEGPLVKRFGIDPSKVSAAVADEMYTLPSDKLHYVERKIFEQALKELEKRPAAEESGTEEFAHNVVVVDIFARKGPFLKKDTTTSLPETHAIILWKCESDAIYLIDPSDRNHSTHVEEPLQSLAIELGYESLTFTIADIQDNIIYTTKGKKAGYSEYSDSSPKPRDCIDIAVKIAFEINEQQKDVTPPNDIMEKVYTQISNQSILHKDITNISFTEKMLFIRELQSTDRNERAHAIEALATDKETVTKVANIFELLPKVKSISLTYLKEHVEQVRQPTNFSPNDQLKGFIQGIEKNEKNAATLAKKIIAFINKVSESLDDPSSEKIEKILETAINNLTFIKINTFSWKQIKAAVDPNFNQVFQIIKEKYPNPRGDILQKKALFEYCLQFFRDEKTLPLPEQIEGFIKAGLTKDRKGKGKGK